MMRSLQLLSVQVVSLALLLVWSLPTEGSTSFGKIQKSLRQQTRVYKHGPKGERLSFSAAQVRILSSALNVFFDRFLSREVNECVEASSDRAGAWMEEDYYPLIQKLGQDLRAKNLRFPRSLRVEDILLGQMELMRMAIFDEGSYEFPQMHFYPYYQEVTRNETFAPGGVARANGKRVVPGLDGFTGTPVLEFNTYVLGNQTLGNLYSEPEFYAAVIAHELAHLLGQKHPGPSDENYKLYQIVILQVCVRTNGQYRYGDEDPSLPPRGFSLPPENDPLHRRPIPPHG